MAIVFGAGARTSTPERGVNSNATTRTNGRLNERANDGARVSVCGSPSAPFGIRPSVCQRAADECPRGVGRTRSWPSVRRCSPCSNRPPGGVCASLPSCVGTSVSAPVGALPGLSARAQHHPLSEAKHQPKEPKKGDTTGGNVRHTNEGQTRGDNRQRINTLMMST